MTLSSRILTLNDLAQAKYLYADCFTDESYFKNLFRLRRDSDRDELFRSIAHMAGPVLSGVLPLGMSLGVFDDATLAGLSMAFDYGAVRGTNRTLFDTVFMQDGVLAHEDALHGRICRMDGRILYILAFCVGVPYRRRGIASHMLDKYLSWPGFDYVVSDVSAMYSLPMYESRYFEIQEIEKDYALVSRNMKIS